MTDQTNDPRNDANSPLDEDRRKFLAACGKFAVVTPPALTLLLSTSLNSEAIAGSGGGSGGGGNPGSPGRGNWDFWKWLENWFDRLF